MCVCAFEVVASHAHMRAVEFVCVNISVLLFAHACCMGCVHDMYCTNTCTVAYILSKTITFQV